jgi:hypothetical protein
MLVTRQWQVWEHTTWLPPHGRNGSLEAFGSHLMHMLHMLTVPAAACATVRVATQQSVPGTVVGGVLFVVMATNLLSPVLGGVLFVLGILGAAAIWLRDQQETPMREIAPHLCAAPATHHPDDAALDALAKQTAAAASDLTVPMHEHLTAILEAARSALPRLRRDGIATPELLAARGVVTSMRLRQFATISMLRARFARQSSTKTEPSGGVPKTNSRPCAKSSRNCTGPR